MLKKAMKIAACYYVDAGNAKFKRNKLLVCPNGFCIEKVHILVISA